MSRNRLLPPLRGVTDQMANVDTPAQFTAPGGMLNVVPNSGKDGRDNLGTRPPLKKTFGREAREPAGGGWSLGQVQ
jgi:hypothetical protein